MSTQNEEVGKARVCFDVDGSIIRKSINGDVPRYDVISMLLRMVEWGNTVFVWSGGGVDYAEAWVRKLGLPDSVRVIPKNDSFGIDLAFDDTGHSPAAVTVKV